jgi:phospholipid/cholesterol/gamma-HCH transport system substrate-binding protein
MSTRPFRQSRRRRTDHDPVGQVLARGLVVILAFGALTYLALTVYNGIPGKNYAYVTVAVPRTGNLLTHHTVRINGRRVGQVHSISAGRDGNADIRLQLQGGTRLPSDTGVLLRANGLLGARYVELRPGHSARALAPGATIRGGEQSLTYGVTDTLDVFDRATRGGLKQTLGGLGQGLLGQGRPLNQTLYDASRAIVPEQRLMRTLADPRTGLAKLLPSADAGMTPLDENRDALTTLMGVGADALHPIAASGARLRQALAAAPPALSQANVGLTRGRVLLRAVGSLAGAARPALRHAPAGLRAATALLRQAPLPLRRTTTLLATADGAVPPVLHLLHTADPLLAPLAQGLSNLTPVVTILGRYGCDIENFGEVFRSVTGFGGNGAGPNGPAMSFRLTAAAPPLGEAIGAKDPLTHRQSYAKPCTFLSKPYPIVAPRPSPGGR